MTHDTLWPAISLADAHARLTGAGAPFELADASVRGVSLKVWKHVPATAAEAFVAARRFGPREFLVLGDERITYDAFARAVLALAADLAARGLIKGDRVALVMRNLPEWPVIVMATLLAGGIAVPLNAWETGTELAHAIRDSGARFVFADAERLARLDELPPCVEQVFAVRAADPPLHARALEDVIGSSAAWATLPEGVMPSVPLDPEDDATIFYTSGTGGAPKGVLGTHRSLTTNIFAAPFSHARNLLRAGNSLPDPQSQPQRVTLLAVPFFHVVGSLSVLLPTMAAGGKLVLMNKFDAAEALALIARERVTVAGGVPAIALALLEHPGRESFDLSSLKLITFGGAPSPSDLAGRIHALGADPGHGWGMTETAATCTTHSGEDFLRRPQSCGPVLPVGQLKVMQDGVEQPPGVAGDLWAFGPNIVKGYWNQPEATAAAFRNGWVRTGDIAMLDEEGFCTILDRAADMLIRGGENIYCSEVENILTCHPAIADAALVGLPHPVLGEVPAALVTARAPVSEQALRDFAARHLAAFKVPVKIMVSPAPLPRNDGGKLMKRRIAEMLAP